MKNARELIARGLMTIPEVMAFSGVKRSTLYKLMAERRLAYVKVGRSRRIPREALEEFLEGRLVLPEGR